MSPPNFRSASSYSSVTNRQACRLSQALAKATPACRSSISFDLVKVLAKLSNSG
jgi:hypothetical protein